MYVVCMYVCMCTCVRVCVRAFNFDFTLVCEMVCSSCWHEVDGRRWWWCWLISWNETVLCGGYSVKWQIWSGWRLSTGLMFCWQFAWTFEACVSVCDGRRVDERNEARPRVDINDESGWRWISCWLHKIRYTHYNTLSHDLQSTRHWVCNDMDQVNWLWAMLVNKRGRLMNRMCVDVKSCGVTGVVEVVLVVD